MGASHPRSSVIWSAAIVLIVGALWFASPALADGIGSSQPCPNGSHASSTACQNHPGWGYLGAYDNFSDHAMTVTGSDYTSGQHVNNAMWFYTTPSQSQWVELGLRAGYWPGVGYAYARYWAEFDSFGNEHRNPISYTYASNANHSYEILKSSTTGQWDIYVDYAYFATSQYQNSSYGYLIQNGLEDTSVDPQITAVTFDHSPLQYVDLNWNFVNYNYVNWWVDWPCAYYGSGYCLNGVGNGSNQWLDSKG